MRRKFLLILGSSLLLCLLFFLALCCLLPYKTIQHFAEKTIEKQLKYEQSIEIESLSLSPLLNVSIDKFQMNPRHGTSSDAPMALEGGDFQGFWCAPYVEEQAFTIDKIFFNPALFKTLKGNPEGAFELTIQDGKISGDVTSKNKTMKIHAKTEQGISMNEFALLSNISGMQIYGNLLFNLAAILEQNKMKELHLDMTAENTAMCPKRLKLNISSLPYFDIPFTFFGKITANIEIIDDKLTIHKLESDGDLKLNVTGDVTLKSKKNPVPRLHIEADIAPSESWVADNNMKIIYQLCEKHDDGSIHLSLMGTTKKIKHDCGTPIPEPPEDPATTDPKTDENTQKNTPNADPKKDETKTTNDADKKKNSTEPLDDPPQHMQNAQDAKAQNPDAVMKPVHITGSRPRLHDNSATRTMPRPSRSRLADPNARKALAERGLDGSMEKIPRNEKLRQQFERDARRLNRDLPYLDAQ